MPQPDSLQRDDPVGPREACIGAVILECLQRRAAGEAIADDAIIDAHPELMPELGAELRKLRVIAGARQRSSMSGAETEVDVGRTPDAGSGRLEIRCPNCHTPMHVAVDTQLTDLTCTVCGSHFSIVDRSQGTRMAPPLSTMGRFELIERLGVGGFGSVWKARDKELDRTVAIKIPRAAGMTPAEQEKFFREARAAAQLRHPSIVSVHEVGRDGDSVYIVSDFVRGVTLGDWLSRRPLTSREAGELGAKIADALHHAHEQGVVHRDLKPANVMIDGAGEPHVMDFGLARRDVGEVTMTLDGEVLGTPAYMSPEQALGEGHSADRRSDIYSLGVILFQLLTGELPFRGNARMIMHQVVHDPPPSPRRFTAAISRDLETITLKCMEKEPARRYSTAAELAAELRRTLAGEPIHARPVGKLEQAWRWARRKPMMATSAALIIFLAIAGPLAAFLINHQRKSIQERFNERNRLIENYAEERKASAEVVRVLRGKLDRWEGKANPWEFWPPKLENSQRQRIIADLLDGSGASLATQLEDSTHNVDETIRGYLALAMLADSVGREGDAKKFYEQARDRLLDVQRETPLSAHLAMVLAQCHANVARLTVTKDRDATRRELELARTIYERLASEDTARAEYQIALLEAELASSMLTAGRPPREQLKRIADIFAKLPNKLPSDAEKLYSLACFLTQRDPISSESRGGQSATDPTE